MQAPGSETTLPGSAPAEKHETSHLLYQGATLAAILLFLISFWSC